MMQLYTTEQSLQSVHRSQLEHRLARVDVKQRTTRASRPVPSHCWATLILNQAAFD